MGTLISLLVFGIILGYVLRRRELFIRFSAHMVSITVYVLLFTLGVSIGCDEDILRQLPDLGMKALILTLGALLGTGVFNWLFGRFVVGLPQNWRLEREYGEMKAKGVSGGDVDVKEVFEEVKEVEEMRWHKSVMTFVSSFSYLAMFGVGVWVAASFALPAWLRDSALTDWSLYVLMIVAGVGVGSDTRTLQALGQMGWKPLLLPLVTIVGTAVGCVVVMPLLSGIHLKDAFSVGSGFAYYSLSSMIIGKEYSTEIAAIALMSNILRELAAIVLSPFFANVFGPFAAIGTGGATSGDTTLPFILKATGSEYAVVSIYHGICLTLLVPFCVTVALWC